MIGSRRSDPYDPLDPDAPHDQPSPAGATASASDSGSHAALGWATAAVAAVVLVFLAAPFGLRDASSAINPATSTGPDAPLESTSVQTWVLSSTVVTSVPTDDAAAEAELGGPDANVDRPAPWIIRVPRATPTGPANQPAATSAPSASATTGSSAAATTSVPATPTSTPRESCPPASPTATASPPAVDGDNDGAGAGAGAGADAGTEAGELGSPSGPDTYADRGATINGPCAAG